MRPTNDTGAVAVTTPTDRSIVLTRGFDAPRALVFDAFTRPELLERWHGARGWHLVECAIDLRVGGRWRFVSVGPGGERMAHGGEFREVVRPERVAMTESFDEAWYAGESLVTHEFAEREERTTLTTTLQYASRAVRDGVLASPMRRGMTESYVRLDAVLARASSTEGEAS